MSTYNSSREEKVILRNNDEITYIHLIYNFNLKVLIIDNLSNLTRIDIPMLKDLYVSISNCVNLTSINSNNLYINNKEYGSYFYLGENMNSLKYVKLDYFKTVKIEDKPFNSLKCILFEYIDKIVCDFKNFPNLHELRLINSKLDDLILISKSLCFFEISHCLLSDIKLLEKIDLVVFNFTDNEYKSLKVEQPVNVSHLKLQDENKIVPYIPLLNTSNGISCFHFNKDNIYDSEYKYYIERNMSKVKILNIESRHIELDLDDINFYVPQKKPAK